MERVRHRVTAWHHKLWHGWLRVKVGPAITSWSNLRIYEIIELMLIGESTIFEGIKISAIVGDLIIDILVLIARVAVLLTEQSGFSKIL